MSGPWLPPAQYIATLPKATTYVCFFVTDEEDRPMQLRAARSPEVWQWPGGNVDAGETPWQCARREALEETGLTIGGEPKLLAMHFLPPLGTWTLNKIGFVFDGGQLTDEQIGSIRLDPWEHSELKVLSLTEWEPVMSAVSYRRLSAAANARRTGTACYLEHEAS
ncbi:NUDIX hydrolase [Streptomyces sp. G-G2]|uniref:NUDIX domain-containing protein n=1 Tax=Streptomyces sp. G-G2 TaxID=3046201 RepID=UPI0024B9ADF5|nr:NUDIX hydrolase [Streptomyces sp. G-G2]MDJ0383149.1 NUDIX hydrolase [Streptomyces sp. G-G2]